MATAEITDPSHLRRIEDGDKNYAGTVAAIETLREAKWQDAQTPVVYLDVFAGKLGRKLDNMLLGLFLSMNGY